MGITRERKLMKRLQSGADLFAFRLNGSAPPPRACGKIRRDRERSRTPEDFGEFDRFVLAEAEEACKRRAALTGYAWQVDHMIPLSRGGKHAWYNIQAIPQRLNSWKCDRLVLTEPGEWVSMLPGALGALF
ncbi:MAG TPA: HNH endonuclease [Pyrinomonadaceae bacterium]|nr:HNH endonuclease [Pyrinomonadaceae bacterium]